MSHRITLSGPVRCSSSLMAVALLAAVSACAQPARSGAQALGGKAADEPLFVSTVLTAPDLFTRGIEGPACDAGGMLYVANFHHQGGIGRVAPDGSAELFVDLPAGSVGNGIRFTRDGTMLVADYAQHNILRVDMGTRQISVLAHEPRMNQPNDLAVDSQDRVYASDPNWGNNTGQLWRVDPDGTVTLLETGMGTTNGIEVGPGDARLYVGESAQRRIWVYDLDGSGQVHDKRLLIEFADHGLDGMRCDVDGVLYVTRYGKGVVARVSPAGELLSEIALAGTSPSNIAFGGPDGRTCYVTVADRRHVETFRVDRPGRSWWLFEERRTGITPGTWGQVKRGG